MLALLPLLALAANANAAPAAVDTSPIGLPIRTTGDFNVWGSENAYLSAKYGGEHPKVARRGMVEREAAGSAALSNIGVSYTVELEIGTPPQKFDSLIDTGSTVMWIIGNCTNDKECGSAKTFNASSSSSILITENPYKIQYGRGTASGHVAHDNVSVGGQMANAAFVLVDELQEWGMALSSLIGFAPRPSSWYQRLQQNWAEPIFSLYLGRANGATDQNPVRDNGMLTLGGVDSSKFSGDIHYIDANLTGWWTIPLDALKVNDQDCDLTHDAGQYTHIGDKPAAVIDSGTTLVNGPRGPITDMYKKLNAVEISSGLYVFPCANNAIPKISLTFGGVDYPLADDDVILGASTVKYIRERFGKQLNGTDDDYYCRASIDIFDPPTADFASPSWIIGASFMRSVYTVHRSEPPAIGFAAVNNDGGSSPESEANSGDSVTKSAGTNQIVSAATPRVASSGLFTAAVAAVAVLAL